MKDSDYMLMASMIALSPHLSKGWGLFIWAIHFIGFLVAIYMERFA
jgi:hypothetical protein